MFRPCTVIAFALVVTFIEANEIDYTCPAGSAMAGNSDSFHFHGTALGGYMVLEPWITPSLFYQFLGKENFEDIGMDSGSFCTALGPVEANRQLRQHWKTWVTEDIIANLAEMGAGTIRIPVGDWMYVPYGDYAKCWEGALEEVDKTIALCEKYNMTVLIDVHCMKGNQNGLDNGGFAEVDWWKSGGEVHFEHWNIREANWIGRYNLTTKTYLHTNLYNIIHSLRVIESIAVRYQDNSAVIGIEPINEPWEFTPMEILKQFYWDSYLIVQCIAPRMLTLLHDSFRLNINIWGNFLQGCKNYAFDTHIYQAWAWGGDPDFFVHDACNSGANLKLFESYGIPVVVGEWSLATDNCAMWLNGFNDNLDGYPKVTCDLVKCPEPYMGYDQPGAPPDPTKGIQGPFGTGLSTPEYGMCPIDKAFDNDDEVMRRLSLAKINAFEVGTHGYFFWNFRSELEPKWDFQRAVSNGWIPTGDERSSANFAKELLEVCLPSPYEKYGQFSFWWILVIVVTVGIIWALYNWYMNPERRGYSAIPGSSYPAHDNI